MSCTLCRHDRQLFHALLMLTYGHMIFGLPVISTHLRSCLRAARKAPATRDPQYKVQMLGVHSAPLASDLSAKRWRQRCRQSILKPELPSEKDCIEAPTICRRGDTFVMFYGGAHNNQPQQIGVAFSQDGLAWERMSDRPFLANGSPGEWNSSESGHPGIFIDPLDGATWLFYQGSDDQGESWYLSSRRIEWDEHIPLLA